MESSGNATKETLNPIDDIFFQKMAESQAFCQEILRVFLDEDTLALSGSHQQESIKNLQARSVILDAYCVSTDGRYFNVEVQKRDDDNHQKRVRYNGACITANFTEKGTKFKDVPDVCVIYITRKDIFQGGRNIYYIKRIFAENSEKLNNGFIEIYVNAEVKDNSKITKLMRIFTEDDFYDDDLFPETSKRKRYFKEGRGVEEMSCVREEIMKRGQLELLLKLVNKGKITMEAAAEEIGVTITRLEELFAGLEKA